MTTTDRDLQAIAYLVGRLRDETMGANHWDGAGNMAALRKIQSWRLVDIMQAATTHGSDPSAKTPSSLVHRRVTEPVQPERITSAPKAAEQCGDCGKHKAFCQCALDARAREYEGARDDGPTYEPELTGKAAWDAARLAVKHPASSSPLPTDEPAVAPEISEGVSA